MLLVFMSSLQKFGSSAMSQGSAHPIPVPYFRTAITAIFKNWTALQMAVSHVSFFLKLNGATCSFYLKEAGGPKSKAIAEWMEEALETWFYENKDLEAVEVNE